MKKKSCAAILTIAGLLCGTSTVLAEGKVDVAEKTLIELSGEYTSDTGYFFAKFENTSETEIPAGSGTLVAFNSDDEIFLTQEYIGPSLSNMILSPGEYMYVHKLLWDTALEDNDVVDYKFSVEEKESGRMIERIPCEAAFEIGDGDNFNNYVYVTFTNITDKIQYDFYATVALYDTEGNLVYADTDCVSEVALHPESTMTVKMYIENDLVKYYLANSIKPATVDAVVYYEIDNE